MPDPERWYEIEFIDKEDLNIPEKFPFPYQPEEFSEEEKAILLRFFTNIDKPVFAIHQLPQEVVGALFSRYSRLEGSLRRVFLDEFWAKPELGIQAVASYLVEEAGDLDLVTAEKRAKKFYERVFADFGDDSVIQLGSVHIAFEYASQIIGVKEVEIHRLAAYMEKSTRYIDFSTMINGHYLFVEPPEIMESDFAKDFLDWNKDLFDAYKKHLPTVINHFREKCPLEKQVFQDVKTGEETSFNQLSEDEQAKAGRAYEQAVKAKALDTIRVFLPVTTATNFGAHFSGQSAENVINHLLVSPYAEARLMGAMAYQELMKVVPNFLQKVDHPHGQRTRQYFKEVREKQGNMVRQWVDEIEEREVRPKVRLVDWDKDADIKIAAQIIYTSQGEKNLSKRAILAWARRVKEEDLKEDPSLRWSPRLAEIIVDSVPDRSGEGLNRRHKLPRAFEHSYAEVEFFVDIGTYKDLMRQRMNSTERVDINAEEVEVPWEFREKDMEEVLEDYLRLAELTKDLHRRIAASKNPSLARAAEYVAIMGNKIRFNIRANLRQWGFILELRSVKGGHHYYRRAAQDAVRQLIYVMPFLKSLFAHINWSKRHGLGRLKAEFKKEQKKIDVDL